MCEDIISIKCGWLCTKNTQTQLFYFKWRQKKGMNAAEQEKAERTNEQQYFHTILNSVYQF